LFTNIPTGEDAPIHLIVYGDYGLVNAQQSYDNLMKELSNGNADMILHVGDFAYDLFTNNGTVGDQWFDFVEPLTSAVPYMGCVGNHEMKYNGTHYTERFQVYDVLGKNSGSNNNWYFSWEYVSGGALVHMAAISTEIYYVYVDNEQPPDFSIQRQQQYEWLQKDLASAKSRGASWLIVYGHRPMYCSNIDDPPSCWNDTDKLKNGLNDTFGLEEILHDFDVDIYLSGHQHSYERTFPVYQEGSEQQDNHTYVSPSLPIHIITGNAGNQEDLDWFGDMYAPWSAVRSATYGYGHLVVYNKTTLYWEQLIAEGAASDWLWVVKED
jgi:hypothetical protein